MGLAEKKVKLVLSHHFFNKGVAWIILLQNSPEINNNLKIIKSADQKNSSNFVFLSKIPFNLL